LSDKIQKYRKELDDIKFYRKEFIRHTSTNDMTGLILKGHLFIENELDNLIDNTLIKPLKISQATFSNKIELSYSLGIIDQEWLGAFRKLNSIRNKYAHDINYNFSEKDFEDLLSTLSKEDKEEYFKDIEAEEFINDVLKALNQKDKNNSFDINHRTRVLLANFWIYLKLQNIQLFTILKIHYLERERKELERI
jgi:hypothetical protein